MKYLSSSLLRSEIKQIIPSPLRRGARVFLLAVVFVPFLLSAASTAFAGSATWNLNPTSGDWNTATNWTPATVPNGPADTATFDISNTTVVSFPFEGTFEVDGIVFNAGASAFNIGVDLFYGSLTISGVGITNNSGIAQTFSTATGDSTLLFSNGATAGNLTFFTNFGDGCFGGIGNFTEFFNTSTAAHGTFINSGGCTGGGSTSFFDTSTAGNGTFINDESGFEFGTGGGITDFNDTSTAADGTFTNNGGTAIGSVGGVTQFFGTSTAGNGTFTSNGATSFNDSGGVTQFFDTSTAANATLIANGGSNGGFGGAILFEGDSIGDTARVEVFDDGNLDISAHNAPGVTVGSIEGSGVVFLGVNNLTVGSNSLNTTFSGVIQGDGSFTKVGQGTLILSNANTYAGGTTIKNGTLVVNNLSGSGTGTGTVQVNAGVLGGRGSITGAVTVGTGSGRGAGLDPGRPGSNPGHFLSILGALVLNSDGIYNVGLKATDQTVDQVMANGLTINGAQFHFAVHGHHVLAPGTVFTVIENTAATPIAGAFTNLPDGSLITANGHTFQASYEGGDGNDLTLTVVP